LFKINLNSLKKQYNLIPNYFYINYEVLYFIISVGNFSNIEC
jgi:hypothetical protein